MRAIDCACGRHFEADDDQLITRCREHVDRDHPETGAHRQERQ